MPALKFLSVILFSLEMFTASAQKEWTLVKDNNGIRVFTRDLDSSKFKAVKIESALEGTVSRFDSIIRDVADHKKWIYNTKNAYIVRAVNHNEVIYYAETTLPWPFTNRDVVIDMTITPETTKDSLLVHQHNVDGIVEKKKGLVRVPSLDAEWHVTQSSENKVNILYYFTIDPGGGLSAWLVNTFATKGPYETFNNLSAILKSK